MLSFSVTDVSHVRIYPSSYAPGHLRLETTLRNPTASEPGRRMSHSADVRTVPEQSAVFTHSNWTFSFLWATDQEVYRLMVCTFQAVFSISPKRDSGKLLESYLT